MQTAETQVQQKSKATTENAQANTQEPVFNYDLERMKDRVENQEFHAYPTGKIKNTADFRRWLSNPKASEWA